MFAYCSVSAISFITKHCYFDIIALVYLHFDKLFCRIHVILIVAKNQRKAVSIDFYNTAIFCLIGWYL